MKFARTTRDWLRMFRIERCGRRRWIIGYPGGWLEVTRMVEMEERAFHEELQHEMLQPCVMTRMLREAEGRCGWCDAKHRACTCVALQSRGLWS